MTVASDSALMDEGLRHSSSRETTIGSRAKSEGAADSEQGLYDSSFGTSHSLTPSARFSRLVASFSARSPRLHRAATRVVTYVRGPRPKVNLPSELPCPK
jgi:hypothetical protein